MMGPPSIFYTCRTDLSNPIATIHREVGKRLSEYNVVALGTTPIEEIDRTITVPAPVRKRDLPRLLLAYAGNYDVVHTGPRRRDKLAYLTKIRGATHVHTLHATPNEPDVLERERTYVSGADHVTAVSEYVKQWAKDTFDVDVPISVIPNGVDLQQYHPDASTTDDDYVLYVGRLVKRKHPELIIDLAERRDDMEFAICGDGPLKSELERRAPPNISFLGRLSVEALVELYARAMVTLCPYENEGFGMVVTESMAAGTPVIGLESGNLKALITPASGELCSTIDVAEWDRTLTQVRGSLEEFDPRSRAGEFAWNNITSQYEDVYQELLK